NVARLHLGGANAFVQSDVHGAVQVALGLVLHLEGVVVVAQLIGESGLGQSDHNAVIDIVPVDVHKLAFHAVHREGAESVQIGDHFHTEGAAGVGGFSVHNKGVASVHTNNVAAF